MIRLSISISDILNSRLEPFKDNLNVSGICQKALLEEVKTQEASQSEDLEDLHQLILVLRRGKVSFKKQWLKRGYEDAVKHWIDLPDYPIDEVLLYEQFILIVENGILPPEAIEEIEREIEDSKEDDNPIICDWESWEEGYRMGTKNIFDKIKDKLKGNNFKSTSK